MFGYVRPFKPYMRVYEYDIYKAVYCGLCKDMGRRYGFFTRFTLSYDLTFLALMDMAVKGDKLCAQPQRCIAHPLRKKLCATCKNDLGYSSAAAIILIYHKLKDDISDKGFSGKLAALAALPFFKGAYKKAAAGYPELAPQIEKAMQLQRELERDKTPGIDRACEPTALMMMAVFGGLSAEQEEKRQLERFGYLLGRFIYITDALDDLNDDYRSGSYNPLLRAYGLEKGERIPREKLRAIRQFSNVSVNLTLGELSEVYVRLELKGFKDILDNIIYLGLKNVYTAVRTGKFHNRSKKGAHIDE